MVSTQIAGDTSKLLLVMAIAPEEIGRRIRDARQARGWTQLDLAREAHVVPGTVSRWERGLLPRVSELTRVAEDVLGVPVAELVGDETPDPVEQEDRLRGIVHEELEGVVAALRRLEQQLGKAPVQPGAARKRRAQG